MGAPSGKTHLDSDVWQQWLSAELGGRREAVGQPGHPGGSV